SATGAVLATGFVVDFDDIFCSFAAVAPVVTVDPTDTCIVACSPTGSATCTLPGRPPVSGVARIEFRPTSPRIGVGCSSLSVSGTNVADAQVRMVECVNPLYDGGIPLLAKSATLTVTGSPGGSATATLSNIAPLSPTGEPVSGVSLIYGTKNAVSCDIDLDSCLSTTGARVRFRTKGWDGLTYGNHRITGAGNGHGDVVCDFSAQGAVSVRYVVRDNIGAVLAEGSVAGPQVACAIDTTCCGGPPPPGGSPNWSMACSADGWDLATNKGARIAPFTVTGLGSSPITGASSVSFTRIVCITAPCPGDGTRALASMDLGIGGVSSMKVSEAKMTLRTAASTSPPSSSGPRTVTATPFGQVHAFPVCAYVAPCDATGEAVCLMNVGSNGQDGVTFTPSEPAAEIFCSSKMDCLSVPAPEGGPSSTTSFLAARRDGLPGHVTVLKIAIVPDPTTGQAFVSFDASERLSSQCLIECLSDTGAVLASAVASNGAEVMCAAAVADGHLTYVGTCDASGRGTVSPFASTGQCVLPDGTPVSGVAKLRCTPVSPGAPAGPLDSVKKEVKCVRNSDTSVSFRAAVTSGGVSVSSLGGAVLTPTTDGVDVSSLSCTGDDGARVHFDTGNGGQVILPVGDLFAGASPCGGPRIRIKHQAWDGSTSATTTLHRVDTGGAMTETFDASGTGAVAVEVVLTSASGAELARVTVPGAVATWLDTAEGASATLNKTYLAIVRSAHEGFFDIAGKRSVTVSGLTATPVPGVHAIRCTALYPPGVAVDSRLASLDITGHSMTQIGIRSPERLRAASGSNYPPPDRFLGALGTGAAVVSERCASIYPCPWDTQELVVSNIGSTGGDGVRLRAHFENGDIPSQTDFAIAGCGSWGETGGPPVLGTMSVSFGSVHPQDGHVTVLKLHSQPSSSNTPAQYAEVFTCDSSGFGSPSTVVRVLNASGFVVQTAVVGPNDPITVGYCNTQQMPTFGNHGNECFLTLPGIGNACYTITLPGGSPVVASRVTFNPFSITRVVEPINEVMFTGTSLSDIVISSVDMEFPPGCPADLGVQGGTPGQDGLLNNNDFVVFIDFFFTGDLRADLGVQGGGAGHDGLLNNNDFVAFIDLYFAGCP
ncbi:MAG: GC-type dockerin domain-anchored protein, partial [Phycisphaerales bacterium]|nr:GC-type dockerin domain-anchored protein [Phycisphaerales bacterium]